MNIADFDGTSLIYKTPLVPSTAKIMRGGEDSGYSLRVVRTAEPERVPVRVVQVVLIETDALGTTVKQELGKAVLSTNDQGPVLQFTGTELDAARLIELLNTGVLEVTPA